MDETRTNAEVVSGQRGLVENGGPEDLSSPQLQKKQTQDPLHKVLTMAKGDGENSYSKNSTVQADINKAMLSNLIEGLELVSLPDQGGPDAPVVVADLGSSSSVNSITNVALIVDKLRTRSPPDAEFQVYFNDLPANDFNQLFQLLSLENGAKNFFGAGVAGSFYDRLFPRSHVHVFHSTFCLHWMSKVPDAVHDKNSPAYNGGNIWYMDSPAVTAAFKEQSSLDLRNFLRARETELKPGGLLYFTFMARKSSDPLHRSDGDPFADFLVDVNCILSDLVSRGLLDKELRDSFNFPVYLRSVEEINEAVASCGGAFRVLTLKTDLIRKSANDFFSGASVEELAIKIVQFYKSFSAELFGAYLPQNAQDILWQRCEKLELSRLRGPNVAVKDAYMGKACLIKI